jgi:hypothetical protein
MDVKLIRDDVSRTVCFSAGRFTVEYQTNAGKLIDLVIQVKDGSSWRFTEGDDLEGFQEMLEYIKSRVEKGE